LQFLSGILFHNILYPQKRIKIIFLLEAATLSKIGMIISMPALNEALFASLSRYPALSQIDCGGESRFAAL